RDLPRDAGDLHRAPPRLARRPDRRPPRAFRRGRAGPARGPAALPHRRERLRRLAGGPRPSPPVSGAGALPRGASARRGAPAPSRHRDVHSQALAALAVFQKAAELDDATPGLVREISSYLERARKNPELRFAKAA